MKNTFYWFVMGASLILSSCSTSLTYPPSPKKINFYRNEIAKDPSFAQNLNLNRLDENERQAFIYLQAENFEQIGNSKAACDRYKYLAEDKTFPNAQLSLIKSLKVCDYLTLNIILLWNTSLKTIRPAFNKLFLKNSIDVALKHGQYKYYVKFSLAYARYLKTKEQKEKHLLTLRREVSKSKYQFRKKELLAKINQKLYSIAPRYIPLKKGPDYFKIAKDYARVRKFKKARSFYARFKNDKANQLKDRIEAFYKLAFTYKLERNKKRFAFKLEAILNWIEKQKQWQLNPQINARYWKLRIEMAKAYWTVNYRNKAANELQKIVKNLTSPSKTKAKAYLTLGLIHLEKKKNQEAEHFFHLGLKQNNINEDILEDLTWNLAWNYYVDRKYEKAEHIFKLSLGNTKNNLFSRKLSFWLGKTLEKLNYHDKAHDLWESLISESSFDYYGIISSIELHQALDPIDSKVANEAHYTPKKTKYPSLDWLVADGNWELAEEFMKEIQNQYQSTDDIESILPLYHFAKWYDGGIFKFYKIKPEERPRVLADHLLAAFPMPYKVDFMAAQKKFKIPASFLMSIARQESAFNRHARSWADAFGILQLTPEKAKRYARKYKIPYKKYSDLYEPKINIPLGAALLKHLFTSGRGAFISSVASYNAGKKPVNRWYKVRFRKDPIEFIEMVPYQETRKYLKLVFRNLVTYKRLLGETVKLDRNFFQSKFLILD